MRWDRLFADLEGQWAELAWQEASAEAAELTRAEWSRVSLADRLRGSRGAVVRLHLAWGETLEGAVRAVGAGWTGLHLPGGGSALVPDASVAGVEGALGAAAPAPSSAGGAPGFGSALRGLARARAGVVLVGMRGAVLAEGTVDRVGADHLDVARHARDEARRREAVRGAVTVPFAALGLLRTPSAVG